MPWQNWHEQDYFLGFKEPSYQQRRRYTTAWVALPVTDFNLNVCLFFIIQFLVNQGRLNQVQLVLVCIYSASVISECIDHTWFVSVSNDSRRAARVTRGLNVNNSCSIWSHMGPHEHGCYISLEGMKGERCSWGRSDGQSLGVRDGLSWVQLLVY